MQHPRTNADLVELVARRASGYLDGAERSARVLEAMREIDRAPFIPAEIRHHAYVDEPLPIGYGQTCSEPSMVAFMLDRLDLRPGAKVLEVGSGCGYAAAIAGVLCRPGGSVLAAELIDGLVVAARVNCAHWPLDVEFIRADGSPGFPDRGPFDRILLSAGVHRRWAGGAARAAGAAAARHERGFDEALLLAQLTEGGILLYPEERGSIFRITRKGGALVRERWPGVAFVPLLGENA